MPVPPGPRYYLREAAVSAAINGVLSIVFVFLMFGGRATVPTHGPASLAIDALPQSFMIALMATLVPTLIARRRFGIAGSPFRAVAKSLGLTLVATLIGRMLWVLLPDAAWPFRAVLATKAVYGALLGAAMTTIALSRELRRLPIGGSESCT